ncbi:MAG: hypothetical protein EPO20_14000 [Betaproteobacteria bacterium]|nr:MAG: hypothetical protein EPO20_14000 [Betaproteobacteria bacterium]
MARLALSAVAIAALAGCSTYYEAPPRGPVSTTSGAPVVSSSSTVAPAPVAPAAVSSAAPAGAYRAGNGIIESIGLVTLPPAGWPASATAGGTVPPVAPGPYRITLRMDDGTIQTLLQDTRAFLVGDRIHLSADGRLSRP